MPRYSFTEVARLPEKYLRMPQEDVKSLLKKHLLKENLSIEEKDECCILMSSAFTLVGRVKNIPEDTAIELADLLFKLLRKQNITTRDLFCLLPSLLDESFLERDGLLSTFLQHNSASRDFKLWAALLIPSQQLKDAGEQIQDSTNAVNSKVKEFNILLDTVPSFTRDVFTKTALMLKLAVGNMPLEIWKEASTLLSDYIDNEHTLATALSLHETGLSIEKAAAAALALELK